MDELSAEIAERLAQVEGRLRGAAERAGRDPGGFRIVAVTKTFPLEVCRAALTVGLERLGENRVQEAEPKVAALPGAEWHLVGRLQSNKARRAVVAFDVIHSIDSHDLLERVDRVAAELDRAPRVLLQLNVSGEETKAGMAPDQLISGTLPTLHAVELVGLMTMLPYGVEPDAARRMFAELRAMRDRLEQASGRALPELSMGMSGDAEAAVAEGATLVRIGTALFGARTART